MNDLLSRIQNRSAVIAIIGVSYVGLPPLNAFHKAVIVCVPTPLGRHMEPDMTYIEKAYETIMRHFV